MPTADQRALVENAAAFGITQADIAEQLTGPLCVPVGQRYRARLRRIWRDDCLMFEPFFTTRLAGTGLGLATVHEIVRDHDGAMNVRSKPGHGSRFEAWLSAAATDSIWQLLESLRWPQFTVASGK